MFLSRLFALSPYLRTSGWTSLHSCPDFASLVFTSVDLASVDYAPVDFTFVDLTVCTPFTRGLHSSGLDFIHVRSSLLWTSLYSRVDFSSLDFTSIDFTSVDSASIDFASERKSEGASALHDARALAGLKANAARAYRACRAVSDEIGACQALSFLILPKGGGIPHNSIPGIVNSVVEINEGDAVLANVPAADGSMGNTWARALCAAIHAGPPRTFDVVPPIGPYNRERVTRRSIQQPMTLPDSRVRHHASIICAPHELKKASLLAAERYAGARPDAVRRSGWTRTSTTTEVITSGFLRSRAVVTRADGGAATARKGVVWMLKFGRALLLRMLNKKLVQAGQTPMSQQTFYALTDGNEYTQLTPDKCCCASCRDLGFIGYELLRQIVRDAAESIRDNAFAKRCVAILIKRIDEEERFRAGEFLSHIDEESSVPQHCLRLVCSSFNDAAFRCDCAHPRQDGATRQSPPTMEQQHPSRALASSDWDDACFVCFDADAKHASLMCAHCRNVAHKSCISTALGNDLPDEASEWTCPSCVREHDAVNHDERCLQCEMFFFLMIDIGDFLDLAMFEAEKAGTPIDTPRWCVAKLAVVEKDLLAYHAHLIRDRNQNMYQPWVIDMVAKSKNGYGDLMDYWAKQGALKSKNATCEGQANKGISVHGRMYSFANPELETREKHPNVPWHTYPSPPSAAPPGPALCREIRRSWSDSSRQTAYDTAATMLAEDIEFRADHPWLTEHFGNMSDGASNYSSTHSVLFYLLNPYVYSKAISVEGMGKDEIDRDNGSEQGKLREARSRDDLTYSRQYIKTCNVRRHKGTINARVEIDQSEDMTAEEKKKFKAIKGIGDLKLHDTRGDSLRSWELFSKKLSQAAGTAVGYGPGREFSTALLRSRHSLAAHRLPSFGAHLSFPDTDALEEGQHPRHNPAPQLSREQKKDAKVAAEALRDEKVAIRTKRTDAAQSARDATYNHNALLCPDCKTAKFIRPSALAKHRANKCGMVAKRLERRRDHDACTIRARVKHMDDDLAEEAEIAESVGLDLRTVHFPSAPYDWVLVEQLSTADGNVAPLAFAGLAWTQAGSLGRLTDGVRVCISAARFEDAAKDDFVENWRTSWYYGWVRGAANARNQTVDVEYADDSGTGPAHFSHLHIGNEVSDVTAIAARPALVFSRTRGGVAHRAGVPVGSVVVSVGGVNTPSLPSALSELAKQAPKSDEKPLGVVLRRPCPTGSRTWRASARSATHRDAGKYDWDKHPKVAEAMDEILKDPTMSRRGQAVETALHAQFRTALDENDLPEMPLLKAVEARMITAWKNNEKSKARAAQDEAALELARKVGEEPDEELESDDEPPGEGDDPSDSAPKGSGGDGDTTSDNMREVTQAHFDSLSGVTVTRLRERLRLLNEAALATVKDTDLPEGIAGTEKSAAVVVVLRGRLASVLAAASAAAAAVERTANAPTPPERPPTAN